MRPSHSVFTRWGNNLPDLTALNVNWTQQHLQSRTFDHYALFAFLLLLLLLCLKTGRRDKSRANLKCGICTCKPYSFRPIVFNSWHIWKKKHLFQKLYIPLSLVVLASAVYWKAKHNRGPGLIILLCGHLWAQLVQFIKYIPQREDTPFSAFTLLAPYTHFQLEPTAHLQLHLYSVTSAAKNKVF